MKTKSFEFLTTNDQTDIGGKQNTKEHNKKQ